MTDEPDIMRVIDDDDAPAVDEAGPAWKVAVIDDDAAVHEGTRFALYDYSLHGQRLDIISAYSAAEGRELLRTVTDVAVILLDVVMETDDAGLKLVDFIRTQLKNEAVRIILRTGQPGQAPERQVIVDYDINDYKAKTELTADKLFTSLTAALRSYQQIQRMVETRRGLEMIIEGASTLFDFKSMQRLAEGVLTQIASLINVECGGILVLRDSASSQEKFSVLAGSGCYRHFAGAASTGALDTMLEQAVLGAFERRTHQFLSKLSVLYIHTSSKREIVVVLETARPMSVTDRSLVEVFCSRLSVAFDNVILYDQLHEANIRLEERVRERTHALTSANLRLSSQRTQLRRSNEFKNEILGTVAHDLRNPLGVILGRAEMMNELVAMTPVQIEKIRDQLGHIRASAGQMTELVNDLISDAMMDAHNIAIRHEPVDLVTMLGEIVTANRALAEKKTQTIQLVAPAHQMWSCDPDRLREAVDNLVSNAIKYSPRGGHIELALSVADDNMLIRVMDEGAGLSEEDVSRLFGRFQRLSARPTGGESSTGLGLSIVKRIVELHGGRVSAQSAGPGRGTTFTIRLPAATPTAPTPQ
jgi:signal transduction histidine kinase/response regulator of citrate/malate metabolism